MTPLEALALQVVARPDDEDVREAYAEAVEPTDAERAELIRLQLSMARTRRAGLDDTPDVARNRELMAVHGARWAGRLASYVDNYVFIRGFVELVTVDARTFVEKAHELCDLAPILHLNVTSAAGDVEELFRCEWLSRIRSISLAMNNVGDAGALAIAESPYLRDLEWLDVSSNGIGGPGLEALAASDNLPRLGYLCFAYNAVQDPTPQHCDDYDYSSPEARALMERYGHREWLDAHPRWLWPPERDAVWITFD